VLASQKPLFLVLTSSDGILFGKEIKHNACLHIFWNFGEFLNTTLSEINQHMP
jgi:hypothetical protein